MRAAKAIAFGKNPCTAARKPTAQSCSSAPRARSGVCVTGDDPHQSYHAMVRAPGCRRRAMATARPSSKTERKPQVST